MSATGDLRSRPGPEAGSTLIEMLVVLSITAMVGAIAFPMVGQGVSRAAFQQAVSGLRADFRMARAQAIRTGREVDMTVEDDGRGYGWTPGPRRALLTGLSLEPAGGRVSFYPDGSSNGGGFRLDSGPTRVDFEIDPDLGVLRRAP